MRFYNWQVVGTIEELRHGSSRSPWGGRILCTQSSSGEQEVEELLRARLQASHDTHVQDWGGWNFQSHLAFLERTVSCSPVLFRCSLPMPPGWHSFSGDDNAFKAGKHCATLSERDTRRAASSRGGPSAVVLKPEVEAQRVLPLAKASERKLCDAFMCWWLPAHRGLSPQHSHPCLCGHIDFSLFVSTSSCPK